MKTAIAVKVRLFARLREQAGVESETVEVPRDSTVADVYDVLLHRHQDLESNRDSVRGALNEEFADWDAIVSEGDEVTFIPPVSGGAHEAGVMLEITAEPLDARRVERAVTHAGAGGICTFTGIVESMGLAQMRKIADEVAERWPEARIAMIHRTGRLDIGEPSVVVSASAPHRAEAIAACKWGIDRLKEDYETLRR